MRFAEIGERLRQLRLDRGLKQEDVAAALHTSRVNYSKMESGERDLKTEHCVALARFFRVSCDYILTGVEAEHVDMHEALGLSGNLISMLMLENEIKKRGAWPSPEMQRNLLPDVLNELCGREKMLTMLRFMHEFIQTPVPNGLPDPIEYDEVGSAVAYALLAMRGKETLSRRKKDAPQEDHP